MKIALFHLRSIIVVTIILAGASACAQENGPPTASPETIVAVSGESSTPSADDELQSAADESAETSQQQSTSVNGVSDRHFECAVQADGNATIAVTTDTTIIGDFALESGDEIAIFNQDGGICAGMAVWNDRNIVITAWGDDSQTDEIDGLITGDPLHFRFWDASQQIEYQVTDVKYETGDGLFVEDGIYIVGTLTIESQ